MPRSLLLNQHDHLPLFFSIVNLGAFRMREQRGRKIRKIHLFEIPRLNVLQVQRLPVVLFCRPHAGLRCGCQLPISLQSRSVVFCLLFAFIHDSSMVLLMLVFTDTMLHREDLSGQLSLFQIGTTWKRCVAGVCQCRDLLLLSDSFSGRRSVCDRKCRRHRGVTL